MKKETTRGVWILFVLFALLGLFVHWFCFLLMVLIAPLGTVQVVKCQGKFSNPTTGQTRQKPCGFSQRMSQ